MNPKKWLAGAGVVFFILLLVWIRPWHTPTPSERTGQEVKNFLHRQGISLSVGHAWTDQDGTLWNNIQATLPTYPAPSYVFIAQLHINNTGKGEGRSIRLPITANDIGLGSVALKTLQTDANHRWITVKANAKNLFIDEDIIGNALLGQLTHRLLTQPPEVRSIPARVVKALNNSATEIEYQYDAVTQTLHHSFGLSLPGIFTAGYTVIIKGVTPAIFARCHDTLGQATIAPASTAQRAPYECYQALLGATGADLRLKLRLDEPRGDLLRWWAARINASPEEALATLQQTLASISFTSTNDASPNVADTFVWEALRRVALDIAHDRRRDINLHITTQNLSTLNELANALEQRNDFGRMLNIEVQ
ncbi:MAG: hypothetical protein ACK5O1_02475 [Holosporales bacterium]|jgi:hypothetical protein